MNSKIVFISQLIRHSYKGFDTKDLSTNLEKFYLRMNQFFGFTKDQITPIVYKDLFCYILTHEDKKYIITRGSHNLRNWIRDFKFKKINGKHRGFDSVVKDLKPLISKYINKNDDIYIGGHSMSSASSMILATDLENEGYNIKACVGIGSPRVGNSKYIKESSPCRFMRYEICNNLDIVCNLPAYFMGFRHYKTLLYINHKGKLFERYGFVKKTLDKIKTLFTDKNPMEFIEDHSAIYYCQHLEDNKEILINNFEKGM